MKSVAVWLLLGLGLSAQAQEVPPFANITSVDFRGTGCDAESARVSITPDLQYMSILYDRFKAEVGAGSPNINARVANKNCVVVVKFDLPAGWSFQFEAVEYRGFVGLPNNKTIAQQRISVDTPSSGGFQGRMRDFQENVMRGPMMDNFVTVYRSPIENMVPTEQNMPAQNVYNTNKLKGGFLGALIGQIAKNQGNGNGHGKGHGPGGPGNGVGPGNGKGHGGLGAIIKRIRKGDMFECVDRVQNATLRIRSRISVTNAGDPSNSSAQIVVDSTDASFSQKLKINWNKCITN
ncbi:MAG: hypothetical protein K0R29_1411 [Pseudobdellovibrio sp.]|jgi:hypothetical protein|nr:hypothetical protein [Pseudobdellovibrio sp.]